MGGASLHCRLCYLRGLAITILVISGFLAMLPGLSYESGAIQPVFSRPNVRIDRMAIAVEASAYGGPAMAADANGMIHAVWSDAILSMDKGIYYSQSTDEGKTWTPETRIGGSTDTTNIAPSIAVDATGGPNHGAIYVVWQRGELSSADVMFIRSTDIGASWTAGRRIDMAPSLVASMYPRVTVDSDGTIYVAYADGRAGDDNIYFTKSIDGGITWSADSPMLSTANSETYPAVAARGGLVCIAWEESSSSSNSLWIATSIDKGVTWQKNSIVTLGFGEGDAMWVSIAIDESGAIHASWVATDSLAIASIAYSQSIDVGSTWSARVKVSHAPASMTYSPNSVTIIPFRGILYVVWADNRYGDSDVVATWSEDNGATWGGIPPSDDIRVDDTDDNGVATDDVTYQAAPAAIAGRSGIYVIWSDNRDSLSFHAYFAGFDLANVMITELRDSPDGMEQIEISVGGANSVDLTGWVLDVDGVPVTISAIGIMAPRSHATIGDPPTSNLQRDITLRDEGGRVRLLDSTGFLIDSIAYGQLGTVPDPISAESVSRVMGTGSYTIFWSRSQIPTFGLTNIVPPHVVNASVVLNEVFYNAANPNDRFIEIYYKGAGIIDIAGYTLAGDSAFTLPTARLTDVDRFYTVRPADAPSLFSQMDISGDNLYLYDTTGGFLDMVGWTSAHTQDRSIVRIPDGQGTPLGFDDPTSVVAGWHFDQQPSLSLVSIGPNQERLANVGDRVYYALMAKNKETFDAYVNIEALPGALGWPITLLKADGVTPLSDSPGDPDNIADVGLLQPGTFGVVMVAVDVPWTSPAGDYEIDGVRASVASDPFATATATIKTTLLPYESPQARADPSAIWVKGAPPFCQPQESVIRLEVSGRGTPIYGGSVQDTVLVIDSSGSMGGNDRGNLRLAAAKHYVDLLNVPDRAAVVDFDDDAFIVNGDHLSSDYEQIKINIGRIDSSGGTDIPEAILVATNELITYGDANHRWIEILLTDGMGGTDADISAQAQRAADNGIMIFTIGLGTGVNENILRVVADMTGGMYIWAQTAEDLEQIYDMIGNVTKSIAGYDDDVTDDIPMISVFIPNYLNYISGSATPTPAYIGWFQGMLNLQWNLTQLRIAQMWTGSIRVTSDIVGLGMRALAYPESKVTYVRHDDIRVTSPFPEVFIDVLAAPPLSDLSVSPVDIMFSSASPFMEGDDVTISSTIYNVGQNASLQTTATFHDGMPPSPQIGGVQPLAPIAVGSGQSVSVHWTVFGRGQHNICVFADPGNLVYEMSETNNIACIYVEVIPRPPTKPDYVPYQPEPSSSLKVALSATINLSVYVANMGNATAGTSSTLSFGNQTGAPFTYLSIPPIASSGLSSRYTVSWRAPSTPGVYGVRALVDCYDVITEWNEGNNEYVWTIEVVPAPMTTLTVGKPSYTGSNTFVTSSTRLSFSAEDPGGTGIVRTMYRLDYGTWVNFTAEGEFQILEEGEHGLEYFSEDRVGNKEKLLTAIIVVDDTPPSTVQSVGDPKYVSDRYFVTSRTPMSLQGTDRGVMPVGLESTRFRIWDGAWSDWMVYAAPFKFDGPDGTRLLEYRSTDLLGNEEEVLSLTLAVDDTPPEVWLSPLESRVAVGTGFQLSSDDGQGSGVRMLRLSIDGGSMVSSNSRFTLDTGTHKIVYMSSDNLGNTVQLEHIVEVVISETDSIEVRFNYKPTIAFLFSLLLVGAAAISAKRRPLRVCKTPWRKYLASWALLALPFVFTEAVTGVVSIFVEAMRIPPIVGWGMGVDSLVLGAGMAILFGRLARRKQGRKGKALH